VTKPVYRTTEERAERSRAFWASRPPIGYVLAGGASSRFGRDKALAELVGKTLLERTLTLLKACGVREAAIVGAKSRYGRFGARCVKDKWPGQGPLGGIITALGTTVVNKYGYKCSLILSCDMPFLTADWLSYMFECGRLSDADVIVPASQQGLEPLCACWNTSALARLQDAFDEGVRKVTEAMKRLRVEVLDETHWKRFDSAGRLFWNMNTQQDYEEAVQVWEAGQA